jgi:2-methylcitrate dehydratase PrpD
MMRERRPFGPEDVDRIVVHGSQVTVDHVGWKYRPAGLTAAQLNLPFAVATLLREGDVFVDQFTESSISDPGRIALAERVEVRHDPEITAKGSQYRHMVRVEIHLRDGSHLEESLEAPRGSEQKFGTEAELVEKFRKLTRGVMAPAQVDRILDAVLSLEKLDDSATLVELLRLP